LGFDNSIKRDDPYSELSATKVETILKWAQDAGMETGKAVILENVETHIVHIIFVQDLLQTPDCQMPPQPVCMHTQQREIGSVNK